jgi:hypothetical protein
MYPNTAENFRCPRISKFPKAITHDKRLLMLGLAEAKWEDNVEEVQGFDGFKQESF